MKSKYYLRLLMQMEAVRFHAKNFWQLLKTKTTTKLKKYRTPKPNNWTNKAIINYKEL